MIDSLILDMPHLLYLQGYQVATSRMQLDLQVLCQRQAKIQTRINRPNSSVQIRRTTQKMRAKVNSYGLQSIPGGAISVKDKTAGARGIRKSGLKISQGLQVRPCSM